MIYPITVYTVIGLTTYCILTFEPLQALSFLRWGPQLPPCKQELFRLCTVLEQALTEGKPVECQVKLERLDAEQTMTKFLIYFRIFENFGK